MNGMFEAFKRGEDALESAKKLIDIDLPASAGRVYISGENLAVSLLLAVSGTHPRDHGKIWNAVKSFYERGILKRDYRSVLETSYRIRIKADYGRDLGGVFVPINKEIIEKQIQELKSFKEEIKEALKKKGIL